MKIAINKFALCCVFVLFCSQALAQTSRPEIFCRYGYRMKKQDDGTYIYEQYHPPVAVLPKALFPFGVCFDPPEFVSLYQTRRDKMDIPYGIRHFDERGWTREAMRKWNIKYNNYKIYRWGSADVVGIPAGPLFVESCDRDEHNIIYIVYHNLLGNTAGRYTSVDEDDGRDFYAIIEIDTHLKKGNRSYYPDRKWTRALFVNVMTHELGHALGLPHMKAENSDIMTSHGFGCKDYATENICELKDYDFERFLWPYKPQHAMTRQQYKEHTRVLGGMATCFGPNCLHMK